MDELEIILDMEKDSKEQKDAIIEYAEKHKLEVREVLEDLGNLQADRENEKVQLNTGIIFED